MGARSAAASVVRHVGGVAAEAALVAALVATLALALSPVYAPAKFLAGTGSATAKTGASIVLNQPSPVYYMSSTGTSGTTSTTANVDFTISQSATTQPWVTLICTGKQSWSAKSVILYGQTLGYFPSWPYGQTFTIGVGSTNKWLEPTSAKCTGELWYATASGAHATLASTSFTAVP